MVGFLVLVAVVQALRGHHEYWTILGDQEQAWRTVGGATEAAAHLRFFLYYIICDIAYCYIASLFEEAVNHLLNTCDSRVLNSRCESQ